MERFEPAITVQDYSGGWNPRWSLNATNLEPNQSPYMVNADYSARFALTKRRGVKRIGDATAGTGGITSIHNLIKLDGTEILIRAYGTVHQKLVGTAWTNFQTGLSNNAKFGYKNILGSVYFGNAVDDFASYDGTSVTTSGTNPKGNIYEAAFSRLFIAGVTAQPQRLYYSSTGAYSTFASGDSGTKDFESSITSIKGFFDRNGQEILNVFLQNGDLYVVGFDTSGIYVRKVRRNVGSISHRATEQLENYNIVVDVANKVRSVGYEENTADIRATSRSFTIKDYLDTLTLGYAAATYARNDYLLAVREPGQTSNSTELIYSEEYNSWKKYTGHQVNQYTIYQNKVTFASATDLNVYQYDSSTYSDNGLPIFFRYDYKPQDWNQPMRRKRVRWIKISGYISTGCVLPVKLYKDDDLANPLFTKEIRGDGAYVDTSVAYPIATLPFAVIPFSGYGGLQSSIEVRPFEVTVSCPDEVFDSIRLSIENYQKDVDFVITHIRYFGELLAEDRISPESII